MTTKKVGIMGGTFDPIHFGHLVIANEVLDKYNMDKIIFIPAGNPPHKNGPKASSFDRYFMTNLATLTNEKFEVSDMEIIKEDKSYTVNTIRDLKAANEDTEYYFISGTDAIIDLPNWREPDKLLKLCKFIAVSRPGYNTLEIEDKLHQIKNQYDGQIELLQVPMLQISSTDIRDRIKKGRSVKYLLPETVEQYIVKNNLYVENITDDYFEKIKVQLEESVGSKTYEHCLRTMEEAVKLAKKYNVDIEKTRIAGLLHDCVKMRDNRNNNLSHASAGAEAAKNIYNIEDIDILNAIRYHTTGREAMSMLEKIIYIADKIEPNRNYEGVEEIRSLAYDNIDKAIIKSISSTIDYVKQRNLELDEDSVKTLNYLIKGGNNI